MASNLAAAVPKKRKVMAPDMTDDTLADESVEEDFDWRNGYIEIKKQLIGTNKKLVESEDRAKKMESLVEELKAKLAAAETTNINHTANDDDDEQLSDDEDSVGTNDPWMASFKELRCYKMLNGNCNVTRKGSQPALGRWVKNQSFLYGNTKLGRNGAKLSQDRIDKLESVGFNFGREFPSPKSWDEYYEELVKHKKIMGHCNVHINFSSPSPIAKWVSIQRVEYKRMFYGKDTLLNMEQVAKLKEIGFKFKGPKIG